MDENTTITAIAARGQPTIADAIKAAVLAERERCAQICEREEGQWKELAAQNNGRESDFAFGSVNSAQRIELAIRNP